MSSIHPTAVVAAGAKLAPDVQIGAYAVIGDDVELGPGVVVDAHVTISGRTFVGARTRIFPSAVVGAEPQIRGDAGELGELRIGEDNVIREFASIHCGSRNGGGCTRIGDDNLIMNHVHVAHDCHVGSHVILASYTGMAGHVTVEDHAVTGAMTGIHQFARVGESAFTAANAMISKDAPPFARVAGDRARFAGLNIIGLERRGFDKATIAALKHACHLVFHSRLRLEPAMVRVEEECGNTPEVMRLLGFLKTSERGFIR